MTVDPKPLRPEAQLMSHTNRCVVANLRPGSSQFSGWLAAIRAGITPAGEVRALSAAGQHVSMLRPRQRTGALRAAAIRAINKDVAQTSTATSGRRLRLGGSLALLVQKDGGNAVEEQLAALPLMNVDAAALVLDGLIGRCARHQIPVDFFDLADVLTHWGSGGGSRATQQRTRVVLDFYGCAPLTTDPLPS